MMNDLSPWLAAIIVSKLLLYIAFAMSLGGMSAIVMIKRYQRQPLAFLKYTSIGMVLGLVFSSLDFLLQVGSFAESGLAGMWDSTYIEILWQSGIGGSYKLRLMGWFALLILLVGLRINDGLAKPIAILSIGAMLAIAASFSWVGHTVEQALWVKAALILHILIAMWWIGLLYPLRCCCQNFTPTLLKVQMHEFGQIASYFVVLLLIAGVAISSVLEGSFYNLLTTSHGNILFLKLTLVAVILAFAAIHKLRLVPSLDAKKAALKLQRSISIEMGIALLILAVTAVLSTFVGPENV